MTDRLSTQAPFDRPVAPARRPSTAVGLVRSLRPKQWAKNVLLYAGIVFAGEVGDPSLLARASAGFAVFCVLSGAVYLVNDVMDIRGDRVHPRKRERPIASSVVGVRLAIVVAVALAAGGLAGSSLLGLRFLAVSAGYLALTVAYSVWLKHVLLVDVISLAVGYVLRAIAGAVVIDVQISPWLLLCTILLALFVGLTKRRHELVMLGDAASDHRQILDEYSGPLLDQLISLVSSATLIAYALYTFFSDTARSHELLIVTLPFVVYGLFRYLYLLYARGEGGSPEDLVFGDRPLLICVVLWAGAVLFFIYR